MASSWTNKWSRLTRMGGDEIRTRIRQEASKRLDLMFYRTGLQPWNPRASAHSAEISPTLFGLDNQALAHRSTLLRKCLPDSVESILKEADDIRRHKFHLLGYDNLQYGPVIDWHIDPVHQTRSPLKPWFKINFLDVHEVGDHKIIWELNRHQHLVTLAKAWRLTGRAEYTTELAAQWYSWKNANPYPLGINWASSLEIAFRTLSWLWVRTFLTGCSQLPPTFREDLQAALQMHGRYIEQYLSTYFSPNTHLIGEAVALLFLGTLCPELSAAERWRTKGWEITLEEAERQVRPDGVYFEQALSYHVYALDFFLHARSLAAECHFAIPQRFDRTLDKMLDVVEALSEAGSIEGFGDDDGGRLFNPRRNRAEHMLDPLIVGAILYGRTYAGAILTEESIWLFGEIAIEASRKPHPYSTPRSRAFLSGGIYLINDDSPFVQQMMIDAGPQGTGRSGHGHADALSVRLSLNERRFLVDAGTFCYICDDDDRDIFRGTGAHNTLKVDNENQALPDGPFAWRSIPIAKCEDWVNGDSFDFFTGSHDGYQRLTGPVLHRRFVFHVKGGAWLIRDVAEGRETHLLQTFWHFAPDIHVKAQGDAFLVEYDGNHRPGDICAAMVFPRNSLWKTEIVEGQLSPAYGFKQAASVLQASIHAVLPEENAALILPSITPHEVGSFTEIGDHAAKSVRGYRYQTSDRAEFFFFSLELATWTCGLWTSDAHFLYCRLENNRFAQVIMVSGSFADWDGRRFVSQPTATKSYEWCDSKAFGTELRSGSPDRQTSLADDFEFLDSMP